MNLEIEGRHALILGGGKGLGRAVARNLASAGARVAIVARTESDLESVLDEMGGIRAGHAAYPVNLMEAGAVESLVARHNASRPSPDIVVHNLGGTRGVQDPLCTLEEWRAVQRFNVEVCVELNRLLIPAMQKKGWGRVVHVSSAAARVIRGALAYGVAKAALSAYTARLGQAVAASGVTVTAIEPGAISSPGSHWDTLTRIDPDRVNRYLSERVASKRFASVDEIAASILFLCSEHASYLAGAVLPADGGAV